MYIIENYSTAVLFCVVTMLCWGSWANTQKLAAGRWRFELFYWDYTIGILLLSVLFALTLGSTGSEGRAFWPDVQQANISAMGSALVGGITFNLANILLVAAIAIAGMSVAFPVGIGIALILGVIVNYAARPAGNPASLFGGVALITLAILLNARAYRRMATAQSNQLATNAPSRGLWLAVAAGLLMGFFYRFVAAGTVTNFTLPEAGKLSPYSALVLFAVGIFISNLLFNTLLMRWPFVGEPLPIKAYFTGSLRNHLTGLLGGAIWCIGMLLNIVASDKASPAVAYGLGQGATVVAALWGIYVWKEFREAPAGTYWLLNTMLLCYIAGLMLLILTKL